MYTLFKSILLLILVSQSAYAVERLRMATTTSTDNSGLIKLLNPPFEKKYKVKLDVMDVRYAAGAGRAGAAMFK